ncbi:glutaredoxin family protein [Photobacterium galatheae]|uniref:Glutaredoxin n=1 Tax=Photobacterium galatheae TaxID=1654360 RepID=A0A066RV51_9GAMM|nr:glutaredoxin family protein [Photobacterium galatheae]KDM91248.1 glutaredoxin [Photobacterium galatheae]MCM0150354.1 glutaredoxin family protein [Photobacterium galatheae]
MPIILYSTEGCHLCEQAYALLTEVGVAEQVNVVDIAFDDGLFSRYGVTIPVVSLEIDGSISELGWPFDASQLANWLKSHGVN